MQIYANMNIHFYPLAVLCTLLLSPNTYVLKFIPQWCIEPSHMVRKFRNLFN